jgi:hypothetical protein
METVLTITATLLAMFILYLVARWFKAWRRERVLLRLKRTKEAFKVIYGSLKFQKGVNRQYSDTFRKKPHLKTIRRMK